MSSPRRFAFAVILGFVVLVSTLLVSEVASRTLRNFVCDGRGGGLHVPVAEYGWGHILGTRTESHGCTGKHYEFRVMVQINSKGLRDKEYAYERSPGVPRILVLGDSVVEAAQVASDEPFTEILEQRLSTPQTPVEVLNAGIAGFSTQNQLLFYRAEAAKYAPDLVVSEFNLQNDVGEILPTTHRRECVGPAALPTADLGIDANGELTMDTTEYRAMAAEGARRNAQRNRFDLFLYSNFYVYRKLHGLFDGEAAVPPPPAVAPETFLSGGVGIYLQPETQEWQRAWQLVAAAYRSLAREVRSRGSELVVAVLPSKEVVSEDSWKFFSQMVAGNPPPGSNWDREAPRRRILAILTELGIPFVDVTDSMRAEMARTGRSGFFEVDPHPTAEGHAVIAAALLPYLGGKVEALRRRRASGEPAGELH